MKTLNSIKNILALSILAATSPVWAQSQIGPKLSSSSMKPQAVRSLPAQKQPTGNLSATSKKITNKKQGGTGVDGGGGNVIKRRERIERKDFEYWVIENKTLDGLVQYIFNAAEKDFLSDSLFDLSTDYTVPRKSVEMAKSLYKKFYRSEKSIGDFIKEVKIYVQDESCLDPITKQKRDASADVKNNKICLSWNHLSKKLYKETFEVDFVPLLIHEYSHFLNATEEEAVFFQKLIASELRIEESMGQAVGFEMEMQEITQNYNGLLNSAKQALVTSDMNALCTSTIKMTNTYSRTAERMYQLRPLRALSRKQGIRHLVLGYRIGNLLSLCNSTQMKAALDVLDKKSYGIFLMNLAIELHKKWEAGIPAYDFHKAVDRDIDLDPEMDEEFRQKFKNESVIRNVSLGNIQIIAEELSKIEEALKWLAEDQSVLLFVIRGT